jgi:hypothetical protein
MTIGEIPRIFTVRVFQMMIPVPEKDVRWLYLGGVAA